MTSGDSHAERAGALNRHLEQLAADGEWQQIAAAMNRRDALLASIPASQREPALRAARQCTERLAQTAASARSQCAEELAALQRGRRATEFYRAHR